MDGAGEIVTLFLNSAYLITLLSTIANHWSQGIKRAENVRVLIS